MPADRKIVSPVEYQDRRIPFSMAELAGIGVFHGDADGAVLHTYSCHSRGLEMLNGACHSLALAPKGRDEDGLRHRMERVRLHDSDGA